MNGTATKSPRPPLYHGKSAAPWIRALKRLHAKGLNDSRIAELLTGLSMPAIETLNREGWRIERVEDLTASEIGLRRMPWTRYQVRHHRRKLGLPANGNGLEAAHAALEKARRVYQDAAGWGHLLPDASAGSSGILLTPRECQALTKLAKGGAFTRAGLLAAMGLTKKRALRNRGRSILARLVRLGLVEAERLRVLRGPRAIYRLAQGARPPEGPRRPTSLELYAG